MINDGLIDRTQGCWFGSMINLDRNKADAAATDGKNLMHLYSNRHNSRR